jgi:hypothetical protein
MPDISDIMDVNIEDLSPKQRQQLQDAVDQFQQKCLLSFKKNRSGVPYLKNEMPRVLLPGESDATTQQEREECMQAFRDTADHVLSRHHRAFLGAFKQMMVAVFGPGMEQVFNKAPLQGGTVEMGESSSQPPLGAKPSSLLHKVLEVSQFSPHCRPQEGNQSSHHRREARDNLCNSRTRTSPRTGSWHSAHLEPHSLPATGSPHLATGCRGIYTAEATTRWGTTEPSTLSRIRVTNQLQARRRMIS